MLNFKGWEKIAADDKTTTLKHDKGHTMTLAHKKLPKIQQEALKRLKFADGEMVQGEPIQVGASKLESAYGPEDEAAQSKAFQDKAPMKDNIAPPQPNININVGGQPQQQSSAQPSPQNGIKQLVNNPVDAQVGDTPDNSQIMSPNGLINGPSSINLHQQGIREQQAVEGAQAQADASIMKDQQSALADQNQRANDIYNEYRGHVDDFAKWANKNPINPKHYQETLGPAGKVATAIGLLLSGAGSGVTGQSNIASDFLNKQIDRDIAAQKDTYEQKKNIYGAYHQMYGEGNATLALTKATMNDIYANKIKQAAAQLGTPMAKAKADQAVGTLGAEKDEFLKEAAQNRAIETANQRGPSSPVMNNPEQQAAPGSQNTATESPQSNKAPSNESLNEMYSGFGINPDAPDKDVQLQSKGINKDQFLRAANQLDKKNGRGHGMPSAEAEESEPKESYEDTHILVPNAQNKVSNIQRGFYKNDYAATQQQLQRAQQVEKQIEIIKKLMPKLRSEATVSGSFARNFSPHVTGALGVAAGNVIGNRFFPGLGGMAASGIGGGAGEALGEGILTGARIAGGEQEKRYQNDMALLNHAVLMALGPGATGEQVSNALKNAAPLHFDDNTTYKQRVKNLIDGLISSTPTDLLDKHGASFKHK